MATASLENLDRLEKSRGHLAWVITDDGRVLEYFSVGGDIYRAPASAPVMTDGIRYGRWEYPDRPEFRRLLRETVPTWGRVVGSF
ncbi:MAG TPA: hypothetical protein VIK99_01270 [Thermaerobacter sp.]